MQYSRFASLGTVGLAALIMTATLLVPAAQAKPAHAEDGMRNMPVTQPSKVETHIQTTQARIASHEAEVEDNVTNRVENIQERVASHEAMVKERLAGAKLQACQNRQAVVLQQAMRAEETATKIEGVFSDIATKAEQFKTDKSIKVSNYGMLIAEVATQKAQVDADIAAAKTQAQAFSCTSDGPKAQIQMFKDNMATVRQDLKDYRTAIHNLIQAIRQANGLNRQASGSATPTPATSSAEEK